MKTINDILESLNSEQGMTVRKACDQNKKSHEWFYYTIKRMNKKITKVLTIEGYQFKLVDKINTDIIDFIKEELKGGVNIKEVDNVAKGIYNKLTEYLR